MDAVVTGEAFCERCFLPLAMCEHGRPRNSWRAWLSAGGRPEGEQAERIAFWEQLADIAERWNGLGPWCTALYRGTCCACGRRWEEGDQIRMSAEDGGWVGSCCGSA